MKVKDYVVSVHWDLWWFNRLFFFNSDSHYFHSPLYRFAWAPSRGPSLPACTLSRRVWRLVFAVIVSYPLLLIGLLILLLFRPFAGHRFACVYYRASSVVECSTPTDYIRLQQEKTNRHKCISTYRLYSTVYRHRYIQRRYAANRGWNAVYIFTIVTITELKRLLLITFDVVSLTHNSLFSTWNFNRTRSRMPKICQ